MEDSEFPAETCAVFIKLVRYPTPLPARTLWTKSRTSRYHKTLQFDLGVLVNLLEEVLGYRLNHLSMSSSSDSRVPPSVHQACHSLIPRKVCFFFVFLQSHKDLSRMISELDAFSFEVFSDFQLWRSPKSFFEYHFGYSEVPTSHELGLLLIGASAFSIPILTFLSVTVVYSVVFLRFYLFYALMHQTALDKRHI